MQIGRAQIQIFTMRAATAASLMAIGEQPCTAEIYQQPYASDADRLVKVNFKWSKQPVHGFARHQERYDREHNGTGEPAKHTDLSCAKAEARVPSLRSRKIVGHGCYQKRKDMSAHVPAVGQQRHRVRHQPDDDLDDHHCSRNPDYDAGAPFRVRKIRNEIVRFAKTGMIRPMHQPKLPRQGKVILKNRRPQCRKSRGVVQIAELRCLAPLVDLVGKAPEIETNSDRSFFRRNPAESFRWFSLSAFVHSEQLRDGHEFESFCEKGVKNLWHRRNRWRVDVM